MNESRAPAVLVHDGHQPPADLDRHRPDTSSGPASGAATPASGTVTAGPAPGATAAGQVPGDAAGRGTAVSGAAGRPDAVASGVPGGVSVDGADAAGAEVSDAERLRVVFGCCHPGLPTEDQVVLSLRYVCGLGTEDIAWVLAVPPATAAARLARAVRRAAAVPHRMPRGAELPRRLDGVLAVIYLMYADGYAEAGPRLVRTGRCDVAVAMARLVAHLLPDRAEAAGLLALVLLQDARCAAAGARPGRHRSPDDDPSTGGAHAGRSTSARDDHQSPNQALGPAEHRAPGDQRCPDDRPRPDDGRHPGDRQRPDERRWPENRRRSRWGRWRGGRSRDDRTDGHRWPRGGTDGSRADERSGRHRSPRDRTDEAREMLDRALRAGPPGPYTIQAAIEAEHARAETPADTDWPAIVARYDQLLRYARSPVVRLNRAAAVAMVDGPAAGLALLDELAHEPALRGSPLLPGYRADLLRRLGRTEEAAAAYRTARALAATDVEREFYTRALAGEIP